jgi:hypothetical protein
LLIFRAATPFKAWVAGSSPAALTMRIAFDDQSTTPAFPRQSENSFPQPLPARSVEPNTLITNAIPAPTSDVQDGSPAVVSI